MKDFTKNLKDGLTKTSQFLKTSSDEVMTKLKEGAEKIGQMGPAAKDQVVKVVNDVVSVLPLLEEAGYRTNQFSIGVSLSPVIEISFTKFKDVPEEELTAMKETHADKRMFKMILGMLQTAGSLSQKLIATDFDFHETVVEISIPPKVSLRYVHKDLDPNVVTIFPEKDE